MSEYKWTVGDSQSCDCDKCQAMCNRPCWPLPEEIDAIVNAGFGHRLMLDWWVGGSRNGGDIYIVSPAIVGYEGGNAPSWPDGRCTFLNDGKCELHGICKPYEGRIVHHSGGPDHHELIAKAWDTVLGEAITSDFLGGFK